MGEDEQWQLDGSALNSMSGTWSRQSPRVPLRAGERIVVPLGVEHKPSATAECRVMLVEPAGTVNSGDVMSDKTAASDVWI